MMSRVSDNDRIWRALADPVRRRILDELASTPQTTGDLVGLFGHLCRTAVMQHLEVLVTAGLVAVRREGRQRWNYINPVPIDRICRRWLDRHTRRMSAALNRLQDVVEENLDATSTRKMEKSNR